MIPLSSSFWRKFFVLGFAFLIFATIYGFSIAKDFKKDLIAYMGIMMMITMVYLELLIIRDHLWILEGSTPEILRWRETFFPKKTIRQQKIRKILVVLVATVIFTWVYTYVKESAIYSFLGIILMITVLYFEVLIIRDEMQAISIGFRMREVEKSVTQSQPQGAPENDELLPKEDAE